MKLLTTTLFALLAVGNSIAADPYTQKYQVCSPSCEKSEVTATVRIDQKRRLVLVTHYFSKNEFVNNLWNDCTFFDRQNWLCKDGNSTLSYSEGKMSVYSVPGGYLEYRLIK